MFADKFDYRRAVLRWKKLMNCSARNLPVMSTTLESKILVRTSNTQSMWMLVPNILQAQRRASRRLLRLLECLSKSGATHDGNVKVARLIISRLDKQSILLVGLLTRTEPSVKSFWKLAASEWKRKLINSDYSLIWAKFLTKAVRTRLVTFSRRPSSGDLRSRFLAPQRLLSHSKRLKAQLTHCRSTCRKSGSCY